MAGSEPEPLGHRANPIPVVDDEGALIDPFANVVGELEDWHKCALDRHETASHRKAAVRDARQRHAHMQARKAEARRAERDWARTCEFALARHLDGKLRLRRARSSLGGRRRPGTRRSTRAAARSGGGDPDPPGPGERGAKYTDACLTLEQRVPKLGSEA